MTALDSATLTSDLAETVRGKLQNAPAPLKLADVVKGLSRPRKTKAADFQSSLEPILDEQVRLGQLFRYPSGKNGEMRYWSHDEKHLLRERALELADTPRTAAALKTQLKNAVKGADAVFRQSVLEELVSQKKLFEHPAKTSKAGSLLGTTPPPPPPPPLEQAKHSKALSKLIAECRKLLAATNVSIDDLLQAVQKQLRPSVAVEPEDQILERQTPPPSESPAAERETLPSQTAVLPPAPPSSADIQLPRTELEEIILKALGHAPVHSLAELRAGMPVEYRGPAFDEAVLRLADEQQVILSQDALPERFSEAEKAEYVRDGNAVFTTIAKWS